MSEFQTKTCPRCGETKPLDEFGFRSSTKSGRAYVCKACERTRNSIWKAAPDAARRIRNHLYMSKYGVTLEEVEKLWRQQGEACAICGRTEGLGKYGSYHVDHDHESGEVRGLLCYRCNTGLGYFAEDVERLLVAVTYLMEGRSE